MDKPATSAFIAASISIGTSFVAGFVGVWVALISRNGAAAKRDITVAALFGIAVFLMLLNVIAAARIAVLGVAGLGLLKVTLMLTAAFALAGIAVGLMRGLRSGKAINTQGA